MNQELTLRIVLKNPPGGVDFGLQKGSGTKYETVQIQRSGDRNLAFEFPVTVRLNKRGASKFSCGEFVQGPPGAAFHLYRYWNICRSKRIDLGPKTENSFNRN